MMAVSRSGFVASALDDPVGVLAQDLRWAIQKLTAAGVESARADAVAIAAHAMNVDLGQVQVQAILDARTPEGFVDMVQARARRIPLQHVTGKAPFRGRELQVGPGVFIPRFDTELLVDLVLERIHAEHQGPDASPVVVDLCTGSGAIAAAVADELPHVRVHAIELSKEAHAWAQRNLAAYSAVDLRLGDATQVPEDLRNRADVVVSNPPYIPDTQIPDTPEVIDHDPAMALWGGGADGMQMPVAIIKAASEFLRPGGYLVMEHASSQEQAVAEAFVTRGFCAVQGYRDVVGRPRATAGVLGAAHRHNTPSDQHLGV